MEHAWDGKKLFPLGSALPTAYTKWAEKMGSLNKVTTVGDLLDRYAIQVIPTKAIKTQVDNKHQVARVRAVFGHMPLTSIKPQMIYAYADKRAAPRAAKLEIALLSHAYTKAVEWGYIAKHPFKGEVRLAGSKVRTRYVEDWETDAALALEPVREGDATEMIQAYIEIKLLTGMSKGDLLRLEPKRHFTDRGIEIKRHKSKASKGTIYEWFPELRAAVDRALKARPKKVDISPYLFCTRRGEGYFNEATGKPDGFDSCWQRFMDRLLAQGVVKERFTEHDLRAKAASDAEDAEQARKMLSHADVKMTNRVYRRLPDVVTMKKKDS